jgi:8-amino-7-oxononanoate synthase
MRALQQRYGFMLYLDEAHNIGITGQHGGGFYRQFDPEKTVTFATFSKGLGSYGSYAAGALWLGEYLCQHAQTFMYSTSLPPAVLAANKAAVEMMPTLDTERTYLRQLREILGTYPLKPMGNSHIVPILIGDEERALASAQALVVQGFWVRAMRYPTVPRGQARLRVCLNAKHSEVNIKHLADLI